MKLRNYRLYFLIVLFLYVLLQLTWWGIQLQRNYRVIYSSNQTYYFKLSMILGEGVVFCILLFLGFRFIHKTIKKDMQMARTENTFLLSVTHELKTPIASVRLMLDTLVKRKTDEDTQRKMIFNAQIALNKLHKQIENILLTTRTSGTKINLWDSTIDLSEAAELELRKYKQWYPNHHWLLTISDKITLAFDQELLSSLLSNLLDNAGKYSHEGSSIELAILNENNHVVIKVKDEGIGFQESDPEKLVKAFYRGQQSKEPGTGLGLYLVHNILKIYNGTIQIQKNAPQGSVIEIKIPRHGK